MIFAIVSLALLAAGAFFLSVSALGLLRLPDFFSRAHAVGKSETLGSFLLLTGLAVHNGLALDSAKLFLIVLFIAVTNPTGIHTLTRAALQAGEGIWVHPDERHLEGPVTHASASDPESGEEGPR